VCSQLNHEENPGQLTDFLGNVNGLETSPNVQGFDIDTYKAFKAGGICAPRIEAGEAFYESGCTSVDPAVDFVLRNIARRRMADFIQDSLSVALKPILKKLMTRARRRAVSTAIREFLLQLQSPTNDTLQRIAAFATDDRTGNTPATLNAGIYRVIIRVQTLPSLDVLVLDTTIGETVNVLLAA